MPVTRTYLVSFNRAKGTDYGYEVSFDFGAENQNHEVEACTFPDLEREVRRLALRMEAGCDGLLAKMALCVTRSLPPLVVEGVED